MDNVAQNLILMGQSFNLSSWSIVRKIILPGALLSVLSGFRITTSLAVILLVAAEMIATERGIGAFILTTGNLYQVDNLLAGVVVAGGGAGGVAAARQGARTVLIERYGFLGGAATGSNVLAYCGFFVRSPEAEPAVGGIGAEVLHLLRSYGVEDMPVRSKSESGWSSETPSSAKVC